MSPSSGQKDDGHLDARLRQFRLQVKAAETGQFDVENQAGRKIRTLAPEEVRCRSKRSHRETGRVQQIRDGIANQRIVVDHEHDAVGIAHSLSAVTGKAKWNTAPRGSFFAAQSRPPCASMIDRQIGNPMPIPCGLVVKKEQTADPHFPLRFPARYLQRTREVHLYSKAADRIVSRLGS